MYKEYNFFYVIGYGDTTDVLLHDWIGNICNDPVHVKDLLKTELKSKWNKGAPFVEVYKPKPTKDLCFGASMASAFSLAKDIVEDWVKNHDDTYDPVPCIINITDGVLTDNEIELMSTAKDIMCLCVPDGNPIIFNIHISTFIDTPKLYFPQDSQISSDGLYRVLYESSSTISTELADGIYLLSERKLCGTEKLFVYNIESVMELYKYVHFALEYAFHHYKVIRP